MSKDLTMTDTFKNQLIVKDMSWHDVDVQLEIHNPEKNVSEEFSLTMDRAEQLIKELQSIVDCNKIGV